MHLWHVQASADQLISEVDGSATALAVIRALVKGGYYYPFDDENGHVRTVVRDAGFASGFIVVPELWSPTGDPLRISRLDTNNLPFAVQPYCPWLLKVAETGEA